MSSGSESGVAIHDDAVLWRRLPPIHVVDGGARPSSAAFGPHPEDGMTSVCVAAVPGSFEAMMRGHDGFAAVWFTAGEARSAGFEVRFTPGDFPGHADLVWLGTSTSARQRAQKLLAKACTGRVRGPEE